MKRIEKKNRLVKQGEKAKINDYIQIFKQGRKGQKRPWEQKSEKLLNLQEKKRKN